MEFNGQGPCLGMFNKGWEGSFACWVGNFLSSQSFTAEHFVQKSLEIWIFGQEEEDEGKKVEQTSSLSG